MAEFLCRLGMATLLGMIIAVPAAFCVFICQLVAGKTAAEAIEVAGRVAIEIVFWALGEV